MNDDRLLSVPSGIGRQIAVEGLMLASPLLSTSQFATFCAARDVAAKVERLECLERLGVFQPLFRVCAPEGSDEAMRIPHLEGMDWFARGIAVDTTPPGRELCGIESSGDAYYSIFQLDHLRIVLSPLTINVQLDSYLEEASHGDPDLRVWVDHAAQQLKTMRTNGFRSAIALLCQAISNRYYPETQGDLRRIRVTESHRANGWTIVDGTGWDWRKYCREWDPTTVAERFRLTPEKLRHAYSALATAQGYCDPLERWYDLVQFVALRRREALKGAALWAESVRSGAHMLRLLHQDLYGEELPHPNEVTRQIVTHIPEREVRTDVRRHLEFIANRYHVNPQPRVVLLLEGETEMHLATQVFLQVFGAHFGVFGIELVCLHGVDAATGGKKDRYQAILRLIDYLHHHQTVTFLVLDNENFANKLKSAALTAKSIHHDKRLVTRPEYVKVWKSSLEFDNWSSTEIASAMTQLAPDDVSFTRGDVHVCREAEFPGKALGELYEARVGRSLEKIPLADELLRLMLSPHARRRVSNRPFVAVLQRACERALLNHPPILQQSWDRNQRSGYLGKKRE